MSETTNTTSSVEGTEITETVEVEETEETTESTPKVYSDVKPYDAFLLIHSLYLQGLCEDRTSQEMFNLATRWAKRTPALAYKLPGHGKGLWRLDGSAFAEWLKAWMAGESTVSGRRSIEDLVEEYTS